MGPLRTRLFYDSGARNAAYSKPRRGRCKSTPERPWRHNPAGARVDALAAGLFVALLSIGLVFVRYSDKGPSAAAESSLSVRR